MNVKSIGSNQVEITSGPKRILISYETPVAAEINGKFYRTMKKWSVTTSKHINAWLQGVQAEKMQQAFFDQLLN
jgi:hypothetical protein